MDSSAPILLLEDDDVDAMKLARALRELNVSSPVVRVENGEEGLRRLRETTAPRPRLIVTDINMPCMNGLEFLREVKNDPALREIPVVVLTTSGEEQDRRESLSRGAAGFLIKPPDYEAFLEMIRAARATWEGF
jgi:CheY-like chemotaxis protein